MRFAGISAPLVADPSGEPLPDQSVVGVEGLELDRGRDAGGQRDQEVQAELVVALALEGEETFDDPQQTPDTGPDAELLNTIAFVTGGNFRLSQGRADLG